VSAQRVDSLQKALQFARTPSEKAYALAELSIRSTENNADAALHFAQQGVQLAENIKNDTAIAFCWRALGKSYYIMQHKDSAEYYLSKAQTLFHKLKDSGREALTLLNLGNYYLDDHQYMKGVNSLMAAKKLAEGINDMETSGRIDYELGSAYADQGLYDEGKQYIRASVAMFKKLNSFAFLSDAYSSYGYVFLQEGNYDSALFYYRQEYEIDQRYRSFLPQGTCADNIGTVFYEMANESGTHPWIDSAYKYFQIALNDYLSTDSKWNIKYEKINIGSVLRNLKQYPASAEYLLDAFHYFDSVYDVNYAYMSAEELSTLYKEMNDYKRAYLFKEIGQKYKDTLDRRNRTDSIAQIFARYETDKKEKEIQLLNTQAALNQSALSRQRIFILFSLLSLALAIVLSIVLINRSRIKQQLKEVNVRNQLAGDLHDEVGSSLSSILLLSKMASGKANENNTDKGMLETIAGNTKEVIDKMSDIVWMMNPKYDEGESVREKLEQYISRMQTATSSSIHLNIDKKIDAIKFPMETRKTILLVCKEALNNALKYADAAVINIYLSTIDKNIYFIVSDNGKGFDIEIADNGNGLGIMALRAKNCNGNLTVQSSAGNGTEIKVIMPIPHFR
jgi:signal transduction histidine kinase